MSDLSLHIMDRVYHLAVAPENEAKLRLCGQELDRRMRAIRESGRVLGYDQIAVMVALDLIWSSFDKDEAAKSSQDREAAAATRLEQLRAECQAAIERNTPVTAPASSESVTDGNPADPTGEN